MLPAGSNAELQARVESFLPWQDFAASLRQLARIFLPAEDWLPQCLQPGLAYCASTEIRCSFDSLLDFWQELPDALAGKITFSPAELLPLFCALADQQRCGTGLGRYPQQQELFRHLLQSVGRGPQQLNLLDLGCGIGFGTLELQKIARRCGFADLRLCGLTSEALEVWMAENHRLPHAPQRETIWQQEFPDGQAVFRVGKAENFSLPEKFSLIFCNGLAGGRFFSRPEQLQGLLSCCQRHLQPQGALLIANSFHAGWRPKVEQLQSLASQNRWTLSGDWQNLCLRPPAAE
jgi:SAM-dependent methyltransferase